MKSIDVVRELYRAFETKDTAAIRATLSDSVEWIQCPGFPGGGHHRGVDNVMSNVFGKFKHDWESFNATVSEFLDCGDRVVVLGGYAGKHRASGKQFKAVFAHVYTVENGRIQTFRQITDTQPIHAAMI